MSDAAVKYETDEARDAAYSTPLEQIDVADPLLFKNNTMWPYFERLRAEAPVHYCTTNEEAGPYWSVTRYKDIMAVDTNHQVFSSEGSIVLRRNEDFPDPADKWLRFAQPEIPELVMGGPILVKAGQPATFDLQVTFQGKPYPQDAIDEVIFLLFDGDGKLSLKGKAEPSENGIWRVNLTARQISRLGAGANSLELAVKSNRIALPSFASHGFATLPADESIPEGIEP